MTATDLLPAELDDVPEDLWASWSPSPSPTGDRVAFVSDRSGSPQVWLDRLPHGDASAVPLPLGGQRVTAVAWSPAGDWLSCLVAPHGRSRSEVWVVRADGSGARRLADTDECNVLSAGGRSHGWTQDGQLVITEITHIGRVFRVDPATGARTLLYDGPLTVALDVSADGSRLLLRHGPRGARRLLVVTVGDGSAVSLAALGPAGSGTVGSTDRGALSPDGETVYACTDVGRDRAALVVLSARTGAVRQTVTHPEGELEDVQLSADGAVAALTWNVGGGESALTLLDSRSGAAVECVLPRAVVSDVALTATGGQLLLTAQGPADPRGVWAGPLRGPLLPVSSPGHGSLEAARGARAVSIEPERAVLPELVRFVSADGTALSGWLYRPPGGSPAPTVVWLHGGPEAQERPVYNSLFQSLVAGGLAVLAPNVRGSSGLGRAFGSADNGAGRYGAFDDVAACARYLVDTGVAEPGRLALMGRSYGGYLTLACLVRYPELFQVGVSVCGMSDLHTFYTGTEPWIATAAVGKYGHPVDDEELLRDLSPLHQMDRLRAPLLLVHGAEDTNVPVAESRQVAAALAARGAPHRLLVFAGEGHEFLGTSPRVQFVRAVLDWVDLHL